MNCAEPHPEDSITECRLDLGHAGSHEYFSTRWPRLAPAGLDDDVAELIERGVAATRSWGDDRAYPVIVEQTTTFVVWQHGESEDDALKRAHSNAWELNLSGEHAIDGGTSVRRADKWQRRDALDQGRIGPEVACPDCGRTAFRREWFHDPYYRCHGPIEWTGSPLRPRREFRSASVHTAVAS
ncbi:hypothetical protein [Streptomyces uncialis]|uniref:hypothetical protein n=1 Tax=Streptomyces uncialis TaxID=1048205 RepID=UPI0033D2608B